MPRGGVAVQIYCLFNLGARWGWVVNATLWPLWSRGRHPLPFVEVAGWAPWHGCGKSRPHLDSMPGSSSTQQVALPIELSRPTRSDKGSSENRPSRRKSVPVVPVVFARTQTTAWDKPRIPLVLDLWCHTWISTHSCNCIFLPPLLVCYSAQNHFPCLVTGTNWLLWRTAIPPICPQHSYYEWDMTERASKLQFPLLCRYSWKMTRSHSTHAKMNSA